MNVKFANVQMLFKVPQMHTWKIKIEEGDKDQSR